MASKKRLLIVTNRFHPQVGGAELNIYFQARELAQHFEVDVVTPLRDNDPTREETHGFKVFRQYNVYNPYNRMPYKSHRALCPGLVPRILAGGYDVIHCFPALNPNNLVALKTAGSRIPVFLTNFDLFDYALLMQEKNMAVEDFPSLRLSERQQQYLPQFKSIFTISERETALIQPLNPKTELSTVPIQLDEYDQELDVPAFRAKYGLAEDVPIILCLSRVANIKGQDLLIHVVPKLKERLDKFKVLIVGRSDYEPDFTQRMQDYVREHGVEDYVQFIGGVPRRDALAALRACAVHVLPMRFMNSGAVVIETWASRRPVLQSTRIDPIYVDEGENGLTFDIGRPDELVEKIVQLVNDPALCQRMGANGRQLVERKFLYSHLIAQYMEAYRTAGGVDI